MIFGGYFSSRLVENIRERKGYTYSPRSWIDHQPLGSVLTVQADVGTEVTAPALLEMRYELGRIATLPVSAEELDAARRYLIGTTALSTQTQSGLAEYLQALSLAGLGLDYLRDLPKRLEKVTVDEVRDAAAEYLAPARLPTVIVGDTKSDPRFPRDPRHRGGRPPALAWSRCLRLPASPRIGSFSSSRC